MRDDREVKRRLCIGIEWGARIIAGPDQRLKPVPISRLDRCMDVGGINRGMGPVVMDHRFDFHMRKSVTIQVFSKLRENLLGLHVGDKANMHFGISQMWKVCFYKRACVTSMNAIDI